MRVNSVRSESSERVPLSPSLSVFNPMGKDSQREETLEHFGDAVDGNEGFSSARPSSKLPRLMQIFPIDDSNRSEVMNDASSVQ